MCQPKSKGGQRCYGHALSRFERRARTFDSTPLSHDEWGYRYDAAMKAGIELASTEKGVTYLREKIAARRKANFPVDDLEHMIDRGVALREANKAVRDAVSAHERERTGLLRRKPKGHVLRVALPDRENNDSGASDGATKSVFVPKGTATPPVNAEHVRASDGTSVYTVQPERAKQSTLTDAEWADIEGPDDQF